MEQRINDKDFFCFFGSRDEMERKAPREANRLVQTPGATWCFDGKDWVILRMEQYITFKVVKRPHIAGRGYVTVIHNPDRLPIDRDRSAVCKGQFRLPIHGIVMITPKPGKDWWLITSEETIGDYLTIRMYPDEEKQNGITYNQRRYEENHV